MRLCLGDFAGGDQQYAEAVLVVFVGQGQQLLAACGVQNHAGVAFHDMGGDAEHFFDCALAHQQVVATVVLDDDRQAPPYEVKGQFIDLAVVVRRVEFWVLQGKLHHGLIHQVADAALVMAVEPGQGQYRLIALATGVDVMLEDDVILGQGAGLVGTQHVHRAQVLDGIEAFDHHLAFGHGGCALGQVGADNHWQHFRGQAHGHCQGKQEGIAPVALGETIEEKHNGHHNQHKADQQPADAVDSAIERGLRARADDGLGQRAKVGARAGGHDYGASSATDHVGAHKADIGQIQQVALVGGGAGGGLLCHIAQGVVLLHRQGFAGEHGLADKQIAGLDQANIRRDHIAGRQLHDIAGHQFAHRYFVHRGAGTAVVAPHHGRGGADHGLEGFGGLGRAVLLPEPQQAAEANHQANDDDFGQVAFFAIAFWQPVVSEKADHTQGQQHIDKRVMQGQQKLHQCVRRLVVSHFVVAIALQAFSGFLLGQACGSGAYIGQGG